MLPVQPQPDGCSDRTVTFSASPGLAPSMKTGPVTGLTKARSSFFRASAVEVFDSWPDEASLVSNCTVSPGAIRELRRELIVPAVMDMLAVNRVIGVAVHERSS